MDLLPALARELVALRPDLIMAVTPPPSRAAKDATSTIPIVMSGVADPVGLGLAASLARPGGNLTGVTTFVPGQFAAKGMQLLHEMVPSAKRIAVLVNPSNEMHRLVPLEVSKAAPQLGVQLQLHPARTADEIEPALQAAVTERAEALMVLADPLFNDPPARLPQLVARIGLPAIYLLRTQVEAGGLMSSDRTSSISRVASPTMSTAFSKARTPAIWRSSSRRSSRWSSIARRRSRSALRFRSHCC